MPPAVRLHVVGAEPRPASTGRAAHLAAAAPLAPMQESPAQREHKQFGKRRRRPRLPSFGATPAAPPRRALLRSVWTAAAPRPHQRRRPFWRRRPGNAPFGAPAPASAPGFIARRAGRPRAAPRCSAVVPPAAPLGDAICLWTPHRRPARRHRPSEVAKKFGSSPR